MRNEEPTATHASHSRLTPRIACVVVAHFLVAAERRDDAALRSRPVVVGGAPEERKEVQDCSLEAIARGVHPGMSLREALSRCSEAAFVQAHPERYRATTQAMVDALLKISPLVESAEPGVIYLQIPPTQWIGGRGLSPASSSELLFETEVARIVAAAAKRASRLAVEVGIADGKFTAYMVALNQVPGVRLQGPNERQRIPCSLSPDPGNLAELPVETLPISTDMQRRLRLLGLRRLGDLAQLPAGAVAAQFGPEGTRAWELAHGKDRSPLVPYHPPRSLTERLAFPSPVVASEQLIAAIRMLLEHALRRPTGPSEQEPLPRGQSRYSSPSGCRPLPWAARTLLLRLHFEDGQAWERQVTFREPVSSVERMLVAIRPKIENAIASGTLAPCTEVEVSLLGVCGESVSQLHLFVSERARSALQEERMAEAARQLKARYGRPMLARILEVEPWSRIPERRFALIDYDP